MARRSLLRQGCVNVAGVSETVEKMAPLASCVILRRRRRPYDAEGRGRVVQLRPLHCAATVRHLVPRLASPRLRTDDEVRPGGDCGHCDIRLCKAENAGGVLRVVVQQRALEQWDV